VIGSRALALVCVRWTLHPDVGAPTGVLRIGAWLSIGQAVDAVVTGYNSRGSNAQLQLEIIEIIVPDKVEQARTMGIAPGEKFNGTVTGSKDGLGVFIEVVPGISGLLHLSRLGNRSPEDFPRGTVLPVRIDRVQPHAQKGIQLGLDLG